MLTDFSTGRVYDSKTVGRIGGPEPSTPSPPAPSLSVRHSGVGVASTIAAAVAMAHPDANANGNLNPASGLGPGDWWARAAGAATRVLASGSGRLLVITRSGSKTSASWAASLAARAVETATATATATTPANDSKTQCIIGVQCYAAAFRISAIGCVIALILSIIAGIRRERLAAARKHHTTICE
jgi:hypothetical protein